MPCRLRVPAVPRRHRRCSLIRGAGEPTGPGRWLTFFAVRCCKEVVNEVRTAGMIVPPPAIAARLRPPGGPPATTVVCIERLRRLNGLPFSLDLTYLVPDIGEPLLGEDLAHNDIFALIEAHAGQHLGSASLTVEAVNADPHSAVVLNAPPGAALLMVERLTRLADGRPVDLEYIRVRGDRVVLHGVAVVGGGTAGTMAAITAAEMGASVLLLDKAHVRHSGALAMGMDGVNNAVIPGKATPEDYVAEITRANEGIINRRTVYQTASRGYEMVRRLEQYGVKFAKDAHGDYDVRRVHRSGSYVLPMPEGKDIKKVLYRVLRRRSIRERVRIENRVMPVRVLTAAGRAVGVAGFNTRTGGFVTVSAGAVILATGACGRLGLPASGYLYGTYENPTNAGDGHAMAYHAGAELSGLECFQINPLIKDYNGPACAYVANPFGGYQVNHRGEQLVDCDYWSGQMMAEVAREIASARGPIYLKLTHLPEETISALENILHTTERPTRGTFHAGRGHDYRTHDVEMHISEIGLCGGHSSSGVWVDENAVTTVPGLYAAGDLACVPHNYMIGAFVFGDLAGAHASEFARGPGAAGPAGPNAGPASLPEDQIGAAHELIYRPLRNPDGPPQAQVEYKLRRFVNDYVAPPKTQARLAIALETFDRMTTEIARMGARTPHELMRCAEVTFIRDCAELAARASLARTESRGGLYHDRADHPGRDDAEWFWHLNIRRGADGNPELLKRPVGTYIVPVSEFEVPARDPGEVVLIPGPPGPGRGRLGRYRPAAAATSARPPEIPELLRLAELQPSVPQLEPYLADSDARVRRASESAR